MLRITAFTLAAMVTVACSDSNSRSSIPNAGSGEKINMIQLDTTSRAATGAPAPQSAQPSPASPMRDSASGPRMEIDSTGKVSPIKR
jgi:hypothetical protein